MRCKMVLSFKDQANHQLFFNVVYDGSEENKQFFKYTPGGMLNLNVVNDVVFEAMQQGKEYYIDFLPAEVA
jgi:hypothetical protein